VNPKSLFRFLTPRPVISGWLAAAAIFAGAVGPSATARIEPSQADSEVRSAVEAKAINVASTLGSVEMDEDVSCPRKRLEVSWTKPGKGYSEGAYVDPLGPAPTMTTRSVNGVVLCRNSSFAYMGFEAYIHDGEWVVHATPSLGEDHHEENDADEPHLELPEPPAPAAPSVPTPTKPRPAAKPAPAPNRSGLPIVSGDGIDGYAQYDPQATCDATAKPGVSDFRTLVLARHSATRSAGITRNCSIGGMSEHKEGRAWDWSVNVNRSSEKAAAEDIISWLLASDSAGRKHAMARRMGVMYIIWDRKIWASYRANDGWRAYNGAKPHTDHVHISFSWAGALRRTSYWTGVPIATGFSPPASHSDRPRDFAHARTKAPRRSPIRQTRHRGSVDECARHLPRWTRAPQRRCPIDERADQDHSQRRWPLQHRHRAPPPLRLPR
jgi:hypothetical protein